jgi:hypothetical protein
MEKLGKERLNSVTRTPVPENLSSLALCSVHLHTYSTVTECLLGLLIPDDDGVIMLNRNVATNYQIPLRGITG